MPCTGLPHSASRCFWSSWRRDTLAAFRCAACWYEYGSCFMRLIFSLRVRVAFWMRGWRDGVGAGRRHTTCVSANWARNGPPRAASYVSDSAAPGGPVSGAAWRVYDQWLSRASLPAAGRELSSRVAATFRPPPVLGPSALVRIWCSIVQIARPHVLPEQRSLINPALDSGLLDAQGSHVSPRYMARLSPPQFCAVPPKSNLIGTRSPFTAQPSRGTPQN